MVVELPNVASTLAHSPQNVSTNPSVAGLHPMFTRSKIESLKPRIFAAEVIDPQEPNSIHEALQDSNWMTAMQDEYNALMKNKTWTLSPLPPGKELIGCKWVYKLKRYADGSKARYKARLVAKGYTQTPGFDFLETFSPVIKPTTIRTVLAIAVTCSWKIR